MGPLQKLTLQVIGSGFEAYEGHTFRIVATLGESGYGLGEVTIQAGAFDILMPGVLGDYTELGIYDDTGRDDACTPGEDTLWQRATGPTTAWGPFLEEQPSGVVVWTVRLDQLMIFEQAGPCNINGNFDAGQVLHCTD